MELIRNEKVADNTVEIEFKVAADEFEKAISKVFRKASAEMTVPGFRKGKAPRSVIEKMYGAEIFFNDAIDELLPQAYEDAVKESGAVVVSSFTDWYEALSTEEQENFSAVWPIVRAQADAILSGEGDMEPLLSDAGIDTNSLPDYTTADWETLRDVVDARVPLGGEA